VDARGDFTIKSQIAELERQLNDYSRDIRLEALTHLLALAEQGTVVPEAERSVANMHCHTFFSFNAYGYSPTALVWLAKRRGFCAIGLVDFDVLDGVDEFLTACDLAGVRGGAEFETGVFIPEFTTREINSPGEPGGILPYGDWVYIGASSRRRIPSPCDHAA
jgi:hypothetical protein